MEIKGKALCYAKRSAQAQPLTPPPIITTCGLGATTLANKVKRKTIHIVLSPFILAGMDAEGLFLIDASNNSLPDAATATKCEDVLDVEPMRRELLQELPDLQLLHEALKSVWMQTTRAC